MMMFALILFGFISYTQLGVGQLPDVDFPIASVDVTWEGAAPEVMESDVVDVVEDAVMSIEGVRTVSSTIRQGSANVSIEFELEKNIDVALRDVQTKIDQAQRKLPKDMDPPIVTKVNPSDHPMIWISVTSDSMPLRDLMTYVDKQLKNQFTTVSGVGGVYLGGFSERNLRVWVDTAKLERYQLTVQDVISAVREEHTEIPAGSIETDRNEFNVRMMGEAPTPEEFANISVARRNGMPIYKTIKIGDVAAIEDGLADVRRIARSQGVQTVGLGISKQRGSNEVEVAHNVLAKMEEVKKTLPSSIQMTVAYNGAKFSEESINELLFTLILSALATSLICWAFLGSWSATLNILMAIPTSILGTFIVIHFLHFTLNTFTVLSLSLVIGIVVDDAIMVLENIVRHQEKGYGRVEAAQIGARQITFAALATTLSLISIFLPVAFMSGIIGRFFFQFGVTIAVAVALSLLEALTLAPMRCAQFLKVEERKTFVGRFVDGSFKWLSARYQKGLERALAKKGLVVLLAIAFFFGSLFLMKFIRKEFVPSQDMSLLLCKVQTPVGSSINFTNEKFKECEAIVIARPEVRLVFAAVGGFSGNEANSGFMFISLHEPKKRPVVAPNKKPLSQGELMALLRKELNKIPEVKAALQDISLSGFSAKRGFPIEFTVKGPDWDKLGEYATTIMDKMEKNEFFTDVDSDYLAAVPEIQVRPDRLKADERGVSVDAIGNVINALIGGEKIGKYTKDGKRYDVRIKVIPSQRENEKDIDRLWVWNNRGEMVQLKDVIKITSKPTPLTITRENRERAITIYSNITPGKSQPDAMKMVETIAKGTLPEGYRVVFIGSSKTFKESFASLAFAFWLGIVVVYMVLASQFNSYKHPIAVLGALPFSISGALIALWAGKQSLNIYSIIGVILLIGLVKKNSILLVDFTNQAREQGMTVMEALKNACPTRLRPILMTSMATVTAAIPPALAIGPGAETRIPMAITIIGGVILSTLITLFFVPCLYSLLNKEGVSGGKDRVSGPAEILAKKALKTLEATVQKAIKKQNGPVE